MLISGLQITRKTTDNILGRGGFSKQRTHRLSPAKKTHPTRNITYTYSSRPPRSSRSWRGLPKSAEAEPASCCSIAVDATPLDQKLLQSIRKIQRFSVGQLWHMNRNKFENRLLRKAYAYARSIQSKLHGKFTVQFQILFGFLI